MHTLRGVALAAALVAAGCNTAPPITYYEQDATLTPETAATLTGSKSENPNIFVGDIRVFVTHIDSAVTRPGEAYQDTLFLVKPGTRYIRIVMHRRATGTSYAFTASTEQFVELEVGKIYVVRGELKGRREASIWVDEVGSAREQARAAAPVTVIRPVVVPIIIVR